jgi:Xaa-Pro aminopeptidase
MAALVKAKVGQAIEILNEYNIDLWLTFIRETSANRDPVLDLIYRHNLTWQSALMISKAGDSCAVIGHYESETARQIGAFNRIVPYHEGIRSPLLREIRRLDPESIAINYSSDDVLSDGLSHGMYMLLCSYFNGTPWQDRIVSAEVLIRALRGRKTIEEQERVRNAISITEEIYDQIFEKIKPGITEREIASDMHDRVRDYGIETAWDTDHCPTVNAGPDSPVGHVRPTELKTRPGQIVHFDFGVKVDGYCSDIQRVVYILRPDESAPPAEVVLGFDTVVEAIRITAAAIKPGMKGYQVDRVCRDAVTQAGYPEFMYATGHQVGTLAHDGAGILGPRWERYGKTPEYPVEVGNVLTIEPGLSVMGYGYIGLEEMVLVTEEGAEFLTVPQTELILIK